MNLKCLCAAEGCGWRVEFPPEARPQPEEGAGYTPYAACPSCKTPDSVHWGCQHGSCLERATGQKPWGWRCAKHRFMRRGRDD